MTAVLELLYKTQDTPLFILIGVGLVFVIIAIVYLLYSQSKVNTYNTKQEEVIEEDISYNIFNDNKEEVVEDKNEEELPILEELVEEKKEDVFDLKNVTKELESLPKERTIQLTDYEREPEETAIISYDELVTQSIPRLEISKALREEVLEEYDYEVKEDVVEEIKEEKVEEPKEIVKSSDNYDHEESFLDGLKDLKNSLN